MSFFTDHFLSHYYRKGDKPFQSLSRLDDIEALKIIEQYDPDEALVYKRFKNPKQYLIDRKRTETWIRSEFVKKGGLPKVTSPHYLTFGPSIYIYEGYNKNCNRFDIDIDKLNPCEISFTYPDSMVSLWLYENHQDKEYFQKEYHGQVFTLLEMKDLFYKINYEDKIWEKDRRRKFDFFIEAQLWSDSHIHEVII